MAKGGTQKTTEQSSSRPGADARPYIDFGRQFAQNAVGQVMYDPSRFFVGPTAGQRSALGAIGGRPLDVGQFSQPYIRDVINAIRNEFDHLRDKASMAARQEATLNGAYGGDRAALLEGARLGELDRAQASAVANLLARSHESAVDSALRHRAGLLNEALARFQGEGVLQALQQQQAMAPLFAIANALQFLNLGMGPVGMESSLTRIEPKKGGGFWSALPGLLQTGIGLFDLFNGGGPSSPTTIDIPRGTTLPDPMVDVGSA